MKKIYLLLSVIIISLSGCGTMKNSSDKKNSNNLNSTSKIIQESENDSTEIENSENSTTKDETTSKEIIEETMTEKVSLNYNEIQTTEIKTVEEKNESTTLPSTTESVTKQIVTELPTTQIFETVPPTTEPSTTSKYIVDYITEESINNSDYKYGLKKITTTYDNYALYSDGTKEKNNSYSVDSYNCDGYNATDAELLEESNAKASSNMSYYNEVISLVNQIRAEACVEPLTLDKTLCQAATMRAVEMNYSDKFSHTRPNGSSCFTVFEIYNINSGYTGENIAAGYSSPTDVVNGWKNSEGHYSNMINSEYTKLGVGMSNESPGSYNKYWVQLFSE